MDEQTDFSQPLKRSRHERFCQQYKVDCNASAAAVRAGYSNKNPCVQGAKCMSYPAVKKRIAFLLGEITAKCDVTAEQLMEEWKKIGFANVQDIVGDENRIRSVSQLAPDKAAAIESIATTKTGVKVTMHSKTTALRNMGEHVGVYEKHGSTLVDAMTRLLGKLDGNTRGLPKDD